jgi:hypothetical protein
MLKCPCVSPPVKIQLHSFLISATDRGEWLVWRPGRFIAGDRAQYAPRTGGWVGSEDRSGHFRENKTLIAKHHPYIYVYSGNYKAVFLNKLPEG